MADLPIVNAIEELNSTNKAQTNVIKDSLSRVQSSIRQGLRMNREAMLTINDTLLRAFQLQERFLELQDLEDQREEFDTSEREREKERQTTPQVKPADDKGNKKVKSGIFDFLKKLLFGAAVVSAVMVVAENWDLIVKGFEAIKPYVAFIADAIGELVDFLFPIIRDNFNEIVTVLGSGALAFGALKIGEKILESAKAFGNAVKKAGSNLKALGKRFTTVLGRVFLPITAAIVSIMGFIDGFKETEGDIGDKVVGGLKGIVQSLGDFFITGTLNLLRDLTSWLAGAMGFNETAEDIASFDPKQYVDEVLGFIFGFIDSAAAVIRDLFTFGDEDKTVLGALGKLTDFVLVPLNTAITFVRNMFGFSSEDQEPFSLREFITQKITSAIDGVKSFFDDVFSGLGDFTGIEMPTFELPEISVPDFPNPFEGITEKIRNIDLSAFDFKILGYDPELDERLRNFVNQIFGIEPAAVGAGGAVPASGGLSGAEVDVRSREVAGQAMQPNVNVTAPQTNVNNSSSTNVNKTTMAPSSASRGRSSPQARDYQDPLFVG